MEINNATVTKKEEKQEKARIDFSPLHFDGHAKCMYTNTKDLADKISSIFGPIFPDFAGCKIFCNSDPNRQPAFISQTIPYGAFYVDFYFKENPDRNIDDKDRNLIRRANTVDGSMASRIENVFGKGRNRRYTVSPTTLEVLEEFVPMNKNCQWDRRIIERDIQFDAYSGHSESMIQISGLSLNALIGMIYGTEIKDEDGHKETYDYQISAIRPVIGSNDEFVVQITQMSRKIIEDVAHCIGLNTQTVSYFHAYNRR